MRYEISKDEGCSYFSVSFVCGCHSKDGYHDPRLAMEIAKGFAVARDGKNELGHLSANEATSKVESHFSMAEPLDVEKIEARCKKIQDWFSDKISALREHERFNAILKASRAEPVTFVNKNRAAQ